ncbi:MAG TPA: RraA family protein [Verrucomicrobiaceae bacterium]|jgi:regulator of RNase E activity RraA
MTAPLSDAQLKALRGYDTCTVANVIDTMGVRLRNEGYTDSTIRCFTSMPSPMVGYAMTIRIRSSEPHAEGRAYVMRTDWWESLLAIPAPRIMVIQDMDAHPGAGAFPGEVLANVWRALGCAGAITNGVVHDLPAIQKMDFQIFASGLSVSHAYAHIVEYGRPVEIGGLRVAPGDLLHADTHGVLCVPADIGPKIPAVADTLLQRERRIIEQCRAEDVSLEKLRETLGAIGN